MTADLHDAVAGAVATLMPDVDDPVEVAAQIANRPAAVAAVERSQGRGWIRIAALAAVLVAVVGVALSARAGSHSVVVAGRPGPSTTAAPGSGAPVAPLRSRWPVGEEWRFRVPWASPQALYAAQYDLWQRSISGCMADRSFNYVPVPYFDTDAPVARLNPLNEAELHLGYDDPAASDPSPRQQTGPAGFDDALVTCANGSQSFVYEAPAAKAFSTLTASLFNQVDAAISGFDASSGGAARLAEWRSCMAAGGFDFPSPAAARAAFANDGGHVGAVELRVRRADFDCDVASKLTESRSKYEAAALTAWMTEHGDLVAEATAREAAAEAEVSELEGRLERNPGGPTSDRAVARLRFVPSFVPAGYVLSRVDYRTAGSSGGVWIDVTYRPESALATDASHVFSIHQRYLPGVDVVSAAAVGEKLGTTVNGHAAFLDASVIRWAEGPNTLMAVGGPFPVATLRAIAESLEKASPSQWAAYEGDAADR